MHANNALHLFLLCLILNTCCFAAFSFCTMDSKVSKLWHHFRQSTFGQTWSWPVSALITDQDIHQIARPQCMMGNVWISLYLIPLLCSTVYINSRLVPTHCPLIPLQTSTMSNILHPATWPTQSSLPPCTALWCQLAWYAFLQLWRFYATEANHSICCHIAE